MPSADSPNRNVALGIAFAGAALERAGWSVAYYDARIDDESVLRGYLRERPRLIGFSMMTGMQCSESKRLIGQVRAISADTKILLGGVHPSLFPKETLLDPDVDFVIVGEGELTIVDLMSALADGTHDLSDITGLAWKDGEQPVVNPERPFMDPATIRLPLTAGTRRLFAAAAGTRHLSYQTTRGCPFRCAFCYNVAFNDRTWRRLPIELVEEHLTELSRSVSFDHVYFVDDYVGRDKRRVAQLGAAMRRRGLTWHSSIRAPDIDAEMATLLEDGNCELLLFGLESASDRVMNDILVKDVKGGIDTVLSCVRHIAATRIKPLYSFMYNVPGETDREREETFRLADWIYHTDEKAQIGFYAYTPYPGTPLYQTALQKGFQPPSGFANWGEMSLQNELNQELRDLYYIAGLRFRNRRGDRTDENFPGWRRLMIMPFEAHARSRWREREFRYSSFERWAVRELISRASARNRTTERKRVTAPASPTPSAVGA
jgi:radical SAM superfamily enzyme YgiQ (UPF0313 family)